MVICILTGIQVSQEPKLDFFFIILYLSDSNIAWHLVEVQQILQYIMLNNEAFIISPSDFGSSTLYMEEKKKPSNFSPSEE